MPAAPLRPCVAPGCRAFATAGTRCSAHAKSNPRAAYDTTRRRTDPALAAAAKLRSSAEWQTFRSWFRAHHPLCCDPLGLHPQNPQACAQIHHVQPLATHLHLALEVTNCRPICTRCHAAIERHERDGQPTAHLFPKP